MPQLMPLMWVSSVMMSVFILLMLMDMYNYKEDYSLMNLEYTEEYLSNKLMW